MDGAVNAANSERYARGGGCWGWHLLKGETLSVIQEEVPPGKSEKLHLHREGRQFFFILDGEAVMELEGREIRLDREQGVAVAPGQRHKFGNRSPVPVRFLVVTAPKREGDRVDLE